MIKPKFIKGYPIPAFLDKPQRGKTQQSLEKDVKDAEIISWEETRKHIINVQLENSEAKRSMSILVDSNLPFIYGLAKLYIQLLNDKSALQFTDLVSEGMIGLINSVSKIDVNRTNNFLSYASWHIEASILKTIENHSSIIFVTNPKKTFREHKELQETNLELKLELELELDDETELMEIVDLSEAEHLIDEEDKNQPHYVLMNESLSIDIERMLYAITEREREIIKMHTGIERDKNGIPIEMTYDEIGEKLGLTAGRTQQIKMKGIRRLRHKCRSNVVKPYIGGVLHEQNSASLFIKETEDEIKNTKTKFPELKFLDLKSGPIVVTVPEIKTGQLDTEFQNLLFQLLNCNDKKTFNEAFSVKNIHQVYQIHNDDGLLVLDFKHIGNWKNRSLLIHFSSYVRSIITNELKLKGSNFKYLLEYTMKQNTGLNISLGENISTGNIFDGHLNSSKN